MVLSLPSMARMENSFTASPTLSIWKTPFSAPLMNVCIIWSAVRPISAYLGAYSLITSSRSPFWFAPFCAPTAIRL